MCWLCQALTVKWYIGLMGCWKSRKVTCVMSGRRCYPQRLICRSCKSSFEHFAAAGGRWFGVLALIIGWPSPMNFRTVLMVSSFKLPSRELSLPMPWTSLGGAVNQDNSCTWTSSTMLVTLTSFLSVSHTG